jgi:hypothetical protein
MESDIFVTVLASKGDIYLCQYACGMWTVDKSNKAIGMTLFTGSEQECRDYFNNL